MEGELLEETECERDIGVNIHQNLKQSSQCAKAAQVATDVLSKVRKAFHYRDRKTWIRMYKTDVRPHVEFAVQAWSPWSSADVECLEKVQQKVVKQVSGLLGKPYDDRLAEL
jgi:ribonuclease P/MRP protein subunit RPP40